MALPALHWVSYLDLDYLPLALELDVALALAEAQGEGHEAFLRTFLD